MAARGLSPPGFEDPGRFGRYRRSAATALLTVFLWLGVFVSVSQVGLPSRVDQIDFESLSPLRLFEMHAVLFVVLSLWLGLGFWRCGHGLRAVLGSQLGLRIPAGSSLGRELGLGLGAGVVLWAGVLATVLIVALFVGLVGGMERLPNEAPKMVLWMGGLPVLIRLLVSLSAGVAEELFFRGFLMPRAGFWLSNALFVLAHLNYEQPFLLLGVALLSVAFSLLTRWRGNVWPAVAAHALFDAIQLLILVPGAAGAAGG